MCSADVGGHVAEVGDPCEAAGLGEEVAFFTPRDAEADGIVGIVGDGEGADRRDRESGIRCRSGKCCQFTRRQNFACTASAVSRLAKTGRSARRARPRSPLGVVAVLVGEEDGVDGIDGLADGFEHEFDSAGGEAGIDRMLGMRGLQEGAIAPTAGPEILEIC